MIIFKLLREKKTRGKPSSEKGGLGRTISSCWRKGSAKREFI